MTLTRLSCKLKAAFLISLFAFLTAVQAVGAVAGGGLGIFPAHPDPNIPYSQSWLIYNLVAGESKRDEFYVANQSNQTVKVKIYPVDAVMTKDGAFSLKQENEARTGVGAWIKLDKNELTLAPNRKQLVGFTFQVPKTAEVGDHMGGIVAEKLIQNSDKGTLRVRTRIGLRVYETVPGKLVKSLKINKLEANYYAKDKKAKPILKLIFGLENTGNVHLNPSADLELINNLTGRPWSTKQANLGTIFPKGSTEVAVVWNKPPAFGYFTIKAKVKYDPDNPEVYVSRDIKIWYVNPKVKLAVVAIVVLLTLFLGLAASFKPAPVKPRRRRKT